MRNLIVGFDIYSNFHISERVLHGCYKIDPCGSEFERSLWHSLIRDTRFVVKLLKNPDSMFSIPPISVFAFPKIR